MGKYRLIENLPDNIVLEAKDKERIKAMGKWFRENNESRMQELLAEIHRDPEFSDWQMDFTPESLNRLSDWFEKHLTWKWECLRANPEDPTSEILYNGQLFPFLIPESRSYVYDIGIYLGWVVIKNHPEWEWFHYMKTSTNNLLWGHMVIGKKKCPNSMWWVVNVCASKIVHGRFQRHGLKALYDTIVRGLYHDYSKDEL